MEQVVSKYLAHLNIPVSRKYCEKLILSHPDYPSLLSIADTLERLGFATRSPKRSCPRPYRVEDLMGMVPGLVDHVEQQEI